MYTCGMGPGAAHSPQCFCRHHFPHGSPWVSFMAPHGPSWVPGASKTVRKVEAGEVFEDHRTELGKNRCGHADVLWPLTRRIWRTPGYSMILFVWYYLSFSPKTWTWLCTTWPQVNLLFATGMRTSRNEQKGVDSTKSWTTSEKKHMNSLYLSTPWFMNPWSIWGGTSQWSCQG